MSVYMTEEEQLAIIKKWWGRYGNMIITFVSIILLCSVGYRYLIWQQDKLTQQASTTYENMVNALSNQNIKSVRSFANQLINDNNHSVYADVAHLTLAKIYISKNKLDQAKDELNMITSNSKMLTFKQIATIRLARILLAEKAYPQALSELQVVQDPTYLPVIDELKGDIYSASGKYKEAVQSYQLAMDKVKQNGLGNLFLEMKKNEVTAQIPSAI